jgi:hypothetical protein
MWHVIEMCEIGRQFSLLQGLSVCMAKTHSTNPRLVIIVVTIMYNDGEGNRLHEICYLNNIVVVKSS